MPNFHFWMPNVDYICQVWLKVNNNTTLLDQLFPLFPDSPHVLLWRGIQEHLIKILLN